MERQSERAVACVGGECAAWMMDGEGVGTSVLEQEARASRRWPVCVSCGWIARRRGRSMEDGCASPSDGLSECGADSAGAAVDYDARYRKGWAYGKKPSKFLMEAIAAHAHIASNAGRCLDVLSLGEGQGRNVVQLAKLGHRCVAVDMSSVGLAKARSLAAEHGVADRVEIVHADLEAFDPAADDAQWDVIISIFCALPVSTRERLHRSCMRSLRPGGVVIIECFAPGQEGVHRLRTRDLVADGSADHAARTPSCSWQRAGPTDATKLVGAAALSSELSELSVMTARAVHVQLAEGRYHRGPAIVTQFVARRPEIVREFASVSYQSAVQTAFAEAARLDAACCQVAKAAEYPADDTVPRLIDDQSDAAFTAKTRQLAFTAAANFATLDDKNTDCLLFSASALVRIACAAALRGARQRMRARGRGVRAACCHQCWRRRIGRPFSCKKWTGPHEVATGLGFLFGRAGRHNPVDDVAPNSS